MSGPPLTERTGFYAWLAWYDGIGDWAGLGAHNPRFRPNVPKNIALFRPTWFKRREDWWHWRHLAEHTQPPPATGAKLWGVVRDASHTDAGRDSGKALCELSSTIGRTVLLQFGQPDENENEERFSTWAAGFRSHGCRVGGWWRVNHSPQARPPNALPVDEWVPDAESATELALLTMIYPAVECAALITLGKSPGAMLPVGKPVMFESFRESAASDQSITNCVRFWLGQGVPVTRQVAGIQAYDNGAGQFASPVDQAHEARACGLRQAWIFPLDGCHPDEVAEIGSILAAR